MNTILLSFVAGALGFHLLHALPDGYGFFSVILLPIAWRFKPLRPVAALLAGFLWSFLNATIHFSSPLDASLEGRDLTLTGVISSIPTRQASITRFEMEVSGLKLSELERDWPGKVRLSWYNPGQFPEPGQRWRLKVRLKSPRGFQNPGGFDYERWLFTHRIQATGYVREWEGNQRLGSSHEGGWLDRLRLRIGEEIDLQLTDTRQAALIKALAIGDRNGLSSEDWQIFSRTGTNHLVAISGLHIGMVAGLVFLLGQWLWRQSEWLLLRLAALRAGAWLALAAAVSYAALAGFSLPTQRALIMLTLGLGALLLGRTLSLSRSFSLALFGVVLIDPLAPLSAGFWLSFGAVAVILFSVAGRLGRPAGWRQWGRVQWVVALGLAPLLFILFNSASVIAPLVNLLLVPWFSFVLVPLVLLAVSLLALPFSPLMDWAGTLAGATLEFLSWSSQLPYALVYRADMPAWMWLASFAGVALLLLPRGMPGRPLGLLLLAPSLLHQPDRGENGDFLFTLLDVGQGLACVVETGNHVLVYDTGPVFPSGFNTAEAVLIPYLRSRGIDKIDQLIISNADRDHAGGVEALRKTLPVSRVMSGETLDFLDTDACRSGMHWVWDGVDFTILHPHPEDQYAKQNNSSCVLMVKGAGGSLLIPGDVEREAEAVLVDRYAGSLRTDILVAPHHGSNTSSTAALVEQVDPAYVLFPTGYRNRFGFPKRVVVERWRQAGAELFNTVDSGAIQFRVDAEEGLTRPLRFRQANPHFWSAPAK